MKLRSVFVLSFALMSLASCNNSSAVSNEHTVTFDTDGGSYIEPQKVVHGEKIKKPDNPIKEYYTFSYWLYNDEEWSFNGYVVTEDMTLLAHYTLTVIQ